MKHLDPLPGETAGGMIVSTPPANRHQRRKARSRSTGGIPRRGLNALSRPESRQHSLNRQEDTALDRFNEAQEDRILHPTKGWRKLSVKRGRAQAIIAEIFAGRRMSTSRMAAILR